MGSRLELQNELEIILESRNVYFQPPESIKLSFPCIIYNRKKIDAMNADNKKYLLNKQYEITVIYEDPDSKLPEKILESFKLITNNRQFVSDNLYHDVFTLFY